MIFKATKKFENIKRLREIIFVFFKYGLGYIFSKTRFELRHKKILLQVKKYEKQKWTNGMPQRLRRALADLGPTFIKFGQVLSTRPDILPMEFIEELVKLQDEAPIFSQKEVNKIIKNNFNSTSKKLFTDFEDKPFAAASLCQVHKAKIPHNGAVAVKIQRPKIEGTIAKDIALMRVAANYLEEKVLDNSLYNMKQLIDEFDKTIHEELDFFKEAENINRFQKNFFNDNDIVIPRVYPKYSRRTVLTMTYLEGVKIANVIRSKSAKYDKPLIIKRLVNMVLKQVFEHGFFHADLHQGNLMIIKDNKIAMIDFGMVGHITPKCQENLSDLLIGIIEKDSDLIIEAFSNMNVIGRDTSDIDVLKKDIEVLLDKYHGLPIKDIGVRSLMTELISIMKKNKLHFPSHLLLLVRTLSMLESICVALDPKYNLFIHLRPYVRQLIRQRYSVERMMRKGRRLAHSSLRFLEIMPEELALLLKKARKGELKIDFEHHGLEKVIKEVDAASDDISYALILAALIIGSSLVMTVSSGPLLFGYPLIGVVGYFFSFLIGIAVIFRLLSRP